MKLVVKEPSENRKRRQLLPTPGGIENRRVEEYKKMEIFLFSFFTFDGV